MDAFYSGSSDVTLPARGERAEINLSGPPGSRDPEVGGPYFCERCDESVPSHDLAAGRALSIYGLTFCAACRPTVEAERFEIHFCDGCGVSIPLAVVEGGEAVLGDGRLVCARCRGRPQRLVRWLRPAAWVAASVLALAAVAAGWPLVRGGRAGGATPAAESRPPAVVGAFRRDADEQLEALRQSLRELRSSLAAESRRDRPATRIEEELDELDRRLREARDEIDAALREVERR